MKIFVATFESKSGIGSQKVFKTKKQAKAWLKKKYKDNFQDEEISFKDWCNHGAWTSRIKQFTIDDFDTNLRFGDEFLSFRRK
jgi:hypothetical protein